MKKLTASMFVFTVLAASPVIAGSAHCRVMDPTSTPLNVRTAPNGTILGSIPNGVLVSVIERGVAFDGAQWSYVVHYGTGQPIGWVFREYIACF